MIQQSKQIFKVMAYVPVVWALLFASFIIRAQIIYKSFSLWISFPPQSLQFGFHYDATYCFTLLMLLNMVGGIVFSFVLMVMSVIKKEGREDLKKNSSMKAFLILYFLVLLFIQFDPNRLFYWMLM